MTLQTLTAEIVERTISGETDKRLQIAGGHYVRKLDVGSDWTIMRVGMRLSTNRTTSWATPPKLYAGLVSGTSAPPGTATPNHFLGLRTNASNWNYTSSYSLGLGVWQTTANSVQTGKSELGAESFASSSPSKILYAGVSTTRHTGLFFTIRKSASTWEFEHFIQGNEWNYDLTRFIDCMNATDFTGSAGSALYFVDGVNSTGLTVDEATYGALDTVCFSWLGEGASNAFEISDIAVRRLA